MKDVSIVVPLYNEQENVVVLHEALSALFSLEEKETEIIYVNDGSSDGTLSRLKELLRCDSRMKIVNLARNYGQTAALMAGVAQSEGAVLVFLDGDLQNDPCDIPRLLAKLEEGYDLVSGWRQQRQDARLTRKLPSWLANRLIAKITGVRLHDYGCTLKAYRREVFEHLQLYGEMHRLIPAYAALNGAALAELAVTHHPRRFGTSKYGLSRTLRLLLDLLTFSFRAHFAGKPMYAFGYVAGIWVLLGTLFALYPLLRKLIPNAAFVPGFSEGRRETSLLVCLGLGTLCLLSGLQAEQAMRAYYEVQHKTPYIVRSVITRATSASDSGWDEAAFEVPPISV